MPNAALSALEGYELALDLLKEHRMGAGLAYGCLAVFCICGLAAGRTRGDIADDAAMRIRKFPLKNAARVIKDFAKDA